MFCLRIVALVSRVFASHTEAKLDSSSQPGIVDSANDVQLPWDA